MNVTVRTYRRPPGWWWCFLLSQEGAPPWNWSRPIEAEAVGTPNVAAALIPCCIRTREVSVPGVVY
jgi:hypothetical protein